MTTKLEESLQQANKLIAAGQLDEAARLVDSVNATHPFNTAVGKLWCVLAKRMGRTNEIPTFAADFYSNVQGGVHQARWAHIMGAANFTLLELGEARNNFARSLEHLITLIKYGDVPRKRKQAATYSDAVEQLFSSGQAEELLWKTCVALAEQDIQAFPYAGTLLGLAREGKLFDYDKDLDIAVWFESREACGTILEENGWVPVRGGIAFDNYRDYIHSETGMTLDVCALTRHGEQKITGGFSLPDQSVEYQRVCVFPSFELEQRASPFGQIWYPQQPEKILSAFYGDWRTPNPNWDSVISAQNLEKYTLLVQCYAYYRLIKSWLSGDLIKAWGYAQQICVKDADDVLVLRSRQWLENILSKSGQEIPKWPQNLPNTKRIYTRMVADLFHEGHVNFLRAARALGTHLTVCVVTDKRVRENKGKNPVMSQAERVAVVSACQYVDAVITDSPDNATLEFMQAHGFDIYTFACASAVERIAKYNQCALLPEHMIYELKYTPGISTSDLVTRIMGDVEIENDS